MDIPHRSTFTRPVLMVDSADHVTGKTGLTLTITASKNAAAFASVSPTVTERGSGWYNIALTSALTDQIGPFMLHVTGTGADPTDTLDFVTPAVSAGTTMHHGMVGAGPTTSTIVDTSLTQTFTDFWAGRVIIFTSGALSGCATTITAFTPASDTLTFVAVPTAPVEFDRYVIV